MVVNVVDPLLSAIAHLELVARHAVEGTVSDCITVIYWKKRRIPSIAL